MGVRLGGLSGSAGIDVLAMAALTIAVLGLIGEVARMPLLATWGNGRPPMVTLAAFGIAGIALLLVATEKYLALPLRVTVAGEGNGKDGVIKLAVVKASLGTRPKYVIRSLSLSGLLVALCGLYFLAGVSAGSRPSWAPAPHTVVCLNLLFLASAAATYQQVRALVIIQMASLVVLLIALSALVGQLFGTRSPVFMGFAVNAGPNVGMALPTAVALLCLGGGYMVNAGRDFFLAVPVRLFSGFGFVALLLLSVAGLPLLIGWLIAAHEFGARYGRDSALAMLVVLNVLLQLPVILHVSRRLFFQEHQLKSVVEQLKDAVARKEELANRLRELSLRDPLTGLANRRAFEDALTKAWRRGRRTGRPLSLLYLDIDFFKKYNDFYGHPQGDTCLVKVAEVLQVAAGREGDLAVRLGGEEFVILLMETDAVGAGCVAKRCHRLLSEQAIPHESSDIMPCVTVSIGVACLQPDIAGTADRLVALADEALYAAKSAGRNRTFVAPALPMAGDKLQ